MENQTAFDLNRAIQTWRENLAQSPAFERENLNELESHLRDSIAKLQTRGLSAEEALIVATKRIGQSGALEKEFGKVNGRAVWLDRLLWALLGVQAGCVILCISNLSRLATGVVSPLGMQFNDILPGFGLPKVAEISLRDDAANFCQLFFSAADRLRSGTRPCVVLCQAETTRPELRSSVIETAVGTGLGPVSSPVSSYA